MGSSGIVNSISSKICHLENWGRRRLCYLPGFTVIKLKSQDLSPEREFWSMMTHSAYTHLVTSYCAGELSRTPTCYCAGVLSRTATSYCAGVLLGVIMIPPTLCNVRPNLKHFYMTVLVLWLTQMSGHPYRKIVWETQQAAEMCLRQPVWYWLRVLRQDSRVRSGFDETRCVGISSIRWGHGGPKEDAISGYAGEFALVL